MSRRDVFASVTWSLSDPGSDDDRAAAMVQAQLMALEEGHFVACGGEPRRVADCAECRPALDDLEMQRLRLLRCRSLREKASYYPDLSPYAYLPNQPAMINVGWLESGHGHYRGTVPEGFLERLRTLAEQPKNLCRGTHDCDLCPAGSGLRGNGEVHVVGADGQVYAAPVLVVHYVEEHGYLPPQEFIDAVMAVRLEL